MKLPVPVVKKAENAVNRFYNLFYAQEKVDAFDARLRDAAAMDDVGEKLMACHALAAEHPAGKLSRGGRVAFWGCGTLVLGGIAGGIAAAAVPPLVFLGPFMIFGAVGGVAGMHAITGDFSGASRASRQACKADRLKDETAAKVTLEDLRQSAQIDAVLTAYPALKERFAEEATRAAIKGPVAAAALPAPEARVLPQKSAAPMRRNLEV